MGLSIDRQESITTKGEPVKMVPLEGGELEETPVTRKPTRMELPRIMLDKFKQKRPSFSSYTRNRVNSNGNLTPKDLRSSTPDLNISPTSSPFFTHVGFIAIDEETKEKPSKDHPQLPGFTSIDELSKPKIDSKMHHHHRIGALDDIAEEESQKNDPEKQRK
ncbi:unnamed protein product, partial [Mesorhabditis belari]|uniref:Uncharacterized protein n=1 Tax=Mesorhabditis belari TaxID=2138241 RepID=A0AAF3J3A8_9BILA